MPVNSKDKSTGNGRKSKSSAIRNLVDECQVVDDDFAETYDRFARPFCNDAACDSDDVQVVFESVPKNLTGFKFDDHRISPSSAAATGEAESHVRNPDILDLDSFQSTKDDFENGVALFNSREPTQNKKAVRLTVQSEQKRSRSNNPTENVVVNWAGVEKFSAGNSPIIIPEDGWKKHNRFRLLMCKICHLGFADVAGLCQHILTHQKSDRSKEDNNPEQVELKFRCGLCNPKREFDSGVQLKAHVDEKHKSARLGFACPECKESFPTIEAFQGHVLDVHGARKRRKKLNWSSEKTKQGIDTELVKGTNRGVDQERKFVCEECGEIFLKKTVLEWHVKEFHLFVRPFECTLCEARFRTKRGREKHERQDHFIPDSPQMRKCMLCPKTFQTDEEFKLHIHKHLGVRDPEEPRYFDTRMTPVQPNAEDAIKSSYLQEGNHVSLFGTNFLAKPAEQSSRVRPKSFSKKLVTVDGEKTFYLSLRKVVAVDLQMFDGFYIDEISKDGIVTFCTDKQISPEQEDFLAQLVDSKIDEIPPIPPSFQSETKKKKRASVCSKSSDSGVHNVASTSDKSTLPEAEKYPKKKSSTQERASHLVVDSTESEEIRNNMIAENEAQDQITADSLALSADDATITPANVTDEIPPGQFMVQGPITDGSELHRKKSQKKRSVRLFTDDVCEMISNVNCRNKSSKNTRCELSVKPLAQNTENFGVIATNTDSMVLSSGSHLKKPRGKRSVVEVVTDNDCLIISNTNNPRNVFLSTKKLDSGVKTPAKDVFTVSDLTEGYSKVSNTVLFSKTPRPNRSVQTPILIDLCETDSDKKNLRKMSSKMVRKRCYRKSSISSSNSDFPTTNKDPGCPIAEVTLEEPRSKNSVKPPVAADVRRTGLASNEPPSKKIRKCLSSVSPIQGPTRNITLRSSSSRNKVKPNIASVLTKNRGQGSPRNKVIELELCGGMSSKNEANLNIESVVKDNTKNHRKGIAKF